MKKHFLNIKPVDRQVTGPLMTRRTRILGFLDQICWHQGDASNTAARDMEYLQHGLEFIPYITIRV